MYRYDIELFDWDGNLFHARLSDLWDSDRRGRIPFPNGKRQFVVENNRTGGFRRFRFEWEEVVDGGLYWKFKSEDGIPLTIFVENLI